MAFLAFRNVHGDFHHIGRETLLTPVRWTADGWPAIADADGRNGCVDVEVDAPLPPPHPWPAEPARDDFDAGKLRLCWNFLRNPYAGNWSLTSRPGFLRLNGSAVTLDDTDSPAFLGQRQRHLKCVAATRLEFSPSRPGEEAGLTVLANNAHHYEIAVVGEPAVGRDDGPGRSVIVRRRIGDLEAIVARRAIAEGPVVLEIRAASDKYTFCYAPAAAGCDSSDPPGETAVLAEGSTRYLSSEVAGGFTGAYFGLYATGRGRPSAAAADFDWFEYHACPAHEKENAPADGMGRSENA